MRLALLVKIVSLVFLGVLTSVITSKLTGHRATAKDDDVISSPSASITTTAKESFDEVPGHSPIDHRSHPKSLIALANINTLTVQANGRNVTVSGTSDIFDRRPVRFVWALRVLDSQDNHLNAFLYDNQVFTMPAGKNDLQPTFNEVIQLEPGSYKVQLVLYTIPPGYNAPGLRTEAAEALESQYRAAYATQPVTVVDVAPAPNCMD